MTQCEGQTREGERCRKTGNQVMPNGYCKQHQYQAIQRILEQLQKLIALGHDPGPALLQQLQGAKQLCDEDRDCAGQLNELLATLRQDPSSKVQSIYQQLNRLGKTGKPEEAAALQLSQDVRALSQEQQANGREIEEIRGRLMDCGMKGEERQREYTQTLEQLSQILKRQESSKADALQLVQSLQNRLDQSQSRAAQFTAVYARALQEKETELKTYRDLYNNMVGREMRLNQGVQALGENEKEVEKSIVRLTETYEQKLSDLRKQFAEKSRRGETILSEREEKLEAEVARLKADLERATSLAEDSTEMMKKLDEKHREAVQTAPHGQLARELVETTDQLQLKNQQLAKLQAQHDQKVAEFARAELAVAQKIDRATAEDRAEIKRLTRDLTNSERKMSLLQREITHLQEQVYEGKREKESHVQTLQVKLRQAETRLLQVHQQRAADRQQVQQQIEHTKTQLHSQKQTQDARYAQMKERLQQDYHDQMAQLKAKEEEIHSRLEIKQRELSHAQQRIAEAREDLQRREGRLTKMQQAFDHKLAEFNAQKENLMTTLAQTQEQARQFGQIERDYQSRVHTLNQTNEVQRQKHEAQVKQLTDDLNRATAHRNEISAQLNRCVAAREGIVVKVNELTKENSRLQQAYAKLETDTQTMKARYEQHMEELRRDSAQMQSKVRHDAQLLQDMSLAHQDVLRKLEEARGIRQGMESTVRKAMGNEAALKRALQDKEIEHEQRLRLEVALKQCAAQRLQASEGLKDTNGQVWNLKRVNSEVVSQMNELASAYQRELEAREADMEREKIKQQVHEENLERQLAALKSHSDGQARELQRQQKAEERIMDSYAEEKLANAQQVALLMEAQRDVKGPVRSGKSTLLVE